MTTTLEEQIQASFNNERNRKLALIERDGIHCVYCNKETILLPVGVNNNSGQRTSVEHVIPKSLLTCSNKNHRANLLIACANCNSKRGVVLTNNLKDVISSLNRDRQMEIYEYLIRQEKKPALESYRRFFQELIFGEMHKTSAVIVPEPKLSDIQLQGFVRSNKSIPDIFSTTYWLKSILSPKYWDRKLKLIFAYIHMWERYCYNVSNNY